MGSARRKPLNVLSPISEYASFSEVWYLLSSVSMSAISFEADADSFWAVMAGGSGSEILWLVDNWT